MEYLSNLTDENWNYKGKNDNCILKNYLIYTFKKLFDDGEVFSNDKYCLFNLGIFSKYNEPIYFYAESNNVNSGKPWYFKGFYTDYDLGLRDITERPLRANYFKNPELLVFDVNFPINVQYKHILEDGENIKRFPQDLQNNPILITLLDGAISSMKKKVMENYRLAIPQYYNGQIQLLLPICLKNHNNADLALVVTKNNERNYYQGHTCLTLDMAYNNARLICRQDNNWLL